MFRHVLYWLTRLANRPVFVIRLEQGGARLTKGQVPLAWVDDCAVVAADFAILHGYVEGVLGWNGLALRFSPSVPVPSQQRLRNLFAVHRLTAGPMRRP